MRGGAWAFIVLVGVICLQAWAVWVFITGMYPIQVMPCSLFVLPP